MQDIKVKPWYKMTELGVIPEDWEMIKLGDICDILKWQLITSDTCIKWNIPVIAWWKQPAYYHNKSNRKHNTITISASWANAGYVNFHKNPIFASDCSTIEEGKNYSIYFIYNYLQLLQKTIYRSQTWWAQPHIHPSDLKPINIHFPKSIDEQELIAKVLSNSDELIKFLDKLIEKKEKIKEWTMQELLTWKRRLPWFDWKWKEKEIWELLDYEQPWNYIVKDTEYNNKYKMPVLTANKAFILWYTYENFWIFENTPVIIFDDFTILNKYVDFPFKVKSSAMKILKLRDKSKNILKFIYERMQMIYFTMWDHKRYYLWEYQFEKVLMPDYDEQKAISKVLSDMDNEIENLKMKRDKYKKLKEWMMQELLTWKIRLV